MHYSFNIIIILLLQKEVYISATITDPEYASMPILFHMDNFEDCMLLEEKALYCSITYEMVPISENSTSKIWEIVKEVSESPDNYRHDHLRHWICVPKTCPKFNGTTAGISECYNNKYSEFGLKGTVTKLNCKTTTNKYPIDTYDVIVAIVFISYIILVCFSSCYEGSARYKSKDVYNELTGTFFGKIVSSFSLPKNWYRLISDNADPDARKLRCIQGIRFYNMNCVILSHTVMTYIIGPVANPRYTETMTKNVLNMFLANGSYAVQTFFLISGWLLSFHFFQLFEHKTPKINYIVVAFINRYIRLTPTLLVLIVFHCTWLVHLSDGPFWDVIVGAEYVNCRKNWWTNLLYLNNYIDAENMCMQQTWYIASDTQLFILSLIILYIIGKYQNHIRKILSVSLFVAILIPFVVCIVNDYDIIIRIQPENVFGLVYLKYKIWIEMYAAGYTNIGGYVIGIIFGYLFYQYRNTQLKIKTFHVVLWWLTTYGVPIFVVLIAAAMYRDGFTYNQFGSALYWAFGRNLFGIGIAVGIFGMTQKIGWFMRWFCEWKPIQIFGRLTYSAYLIHVAFARTRAGFMRAPVLLADFMILYSTVGDITLSYLAATVLCLFVEMPISALQKLWVPQLERKRISPNPDVSDECLNSSTKI